MQQQWRLRHCQVAVAVVVADLDHRRRRRTCSRVSTVATLVRGLCRRRRRRRHCRRHRRRCHRLLVLLLPPVHLHMHTHTSASVGEVFGSQVQVTQGRQAGMQAGMQAGRQAHKHAYLQAARLWLRSTHARKGSAVRTDQSRIAEPLPLPLPSSCGLRHAEVDPHVELCTRTETVSKQASKRGTGMVQRAPCICASWRAAFEPLREREIKLTGQLRPTRIHVPCWALSWIGHTRRPGACAERRSGSHGLLSSRLRQYFLYRERLAHALQNERNRVGCTVNMGEWGRKGRVGTGSALAHRLQRPHLATGRFVRQGVLAAKAQDSSAGRFVHL